MTISTPTPDFSEFPRYAKLTELLQAYAASWPNLFALSSIGKSYEGRDIWLITATNTATGKHEDKPAFWIDGNIHAAELSACNACLYYLDQLAKGYGKDAQITHLLDTRTFYICPRLNPDGAELALADKPRHIRSSTRPYPFDEAPIEGLTVEDVDGDGNVLSMRIPDPHGAWKPHPQDARLMIPREPDDVAPPPGGTYYRILPEGTLTNYDGVTVKVNKDREGLDLNRNFPAFWRQEFEQVGAGPYPASEPEVRAMVHFIVHRPNIGAAVSFHTHSGVILRPMGMEADDKMIPEDLWTIKKMSDKGHQLTGYPAISIYHEFKYHPHEHITGTQDWVYEHLGALFWTVEIWSPIQQAGIKGYKFIEWYRDHPAEDDLKLLKWSDEELGSKGYHAWRPFNHPQLGPVEIGGWDKMNTWRNPPPALREQEVARFPKWLSYIAATLPKLELLKAEVTALGDDHYKLQVAVCNSGYLPSYISKRAMERKQVRGCVFELKLPDGATLIAGKLREQAEHLEGRNNTGTLQAFLPSPKATGDRCMRAWVVHAPKGGAVEVSVRADRAGAINAFLNFA